MPPERVRWKASPFLLRASSNHLVVNGQEHHDSLEFRVDRILLKSNVVHFAQTVTVRATTLESLGTSLKAPKWRGELMNESRLAPLAAQVAVEIGTVPDCP